MDWGYLSREGLVVQGNRSSACHFVAVDTLACDGMASEAGYAQEDSSGGRGASRLHFRSRMRWNRSLLLAALLVLPRLAWAQTTPQPATPTCTGPSVQVAGISMTLAALQSDNFYHEIPLTTAGTVLNLAECTCDPRDLFVELKLTGSIGADVTALEVWVGSACNLQANRNTTGQGAACVRVVRQDNLVVDDFRAGGAGSGGPLFQPIPVRSLLAPSGAECSALAGGLSNGVFFLFSTGTTSGDSTNYCSLVLPAQIQPPLPPELPDTNQASGGDGAVTVRWEAPTTTTRQPVRYQVLCATADGQPVPGKGLSSGLRQYYTTCTRSNQLYRQYIEAPPSYPGPGGGGTDGGTNDDGGIDGGLDGGTDDAGDDGGMDGGVNGGLDGGTGGSCTALNTPQGLLDLDPAYLCSGLIGGSASQSRIDGLRNGQSYQFLVVGIDAYGNAVPASGVSCDRAQLVDDFYNRYRNAGGKPQGFCFIATAAYGSYESPYVQVLRRFRDEVLLPSAQGRAFVDWYYRNSPGAASYIAAPDHGAARWMARMALWPAIAMAWLWLALGPGALVLLAAGCAAWTLRRRLWQSLALGAEGRAS
jgi:hypothetical protein